MRLKTTEEALRSEIAKLREQKNDVELGWRRCSEVCAILQTQRDCLRRVLERFATGTVDDPRDVREQAQQALAENKRWLPTREDADESEMVWSHFEDKT